MVPTLSPLLFTTIVKTKKKKKKKPARVFNDRRQPTATLRRALFDTIFFFSLRLLRGKVDGFHFCEKYPCRLDSRNQSREFSRVFEMCSMEKARMVIYILCSAFCYPVGVLFYKV